METNPERELPSPLDTLELPKHEASAPENLPTEVTEMTEAEPLPFSLTQAAIDAAPMAEIIDTKPAPLTPARQKQASYGALFSIVIIMAIVIVGAFYSWGKRIHDQGGLAPATTGTSATY